MGPSAGLPDTGAQVNSATGGCCAVTVVTPLRWPMNDTTVPAGTLGRLPFSVTDVGVISVTARYPPGTPRAGRPLGQGQRRNVGLGADRFSGIGVKHRDLEIIQVVLNVAPFHWRLRNLPDHQIRHIVHVSAPQWE